MALRKKILENSIIDYSIKDKEQLIIEKYKYSGNEKIKIKDKLGKLKKTFTYDEFAPPLTSFYKQETANEKTIADFFKKKSKKETKPTQRFEYDEELFKLTSFNDNKKIDKKEKVFFNENKILFTKKTINTRFTYAYIRVSVRVYFNGFYVIATGRSDYLERNIKKIEIMYYLNQAIKRAIAPYGSNVKFKPLSWEYAYYLKKYQDF